MPYPYVLKTEYESLRMRKFKKEQFFSAPLLFPPQTNITIPADPPNPGTKGRKEKKKRGGEISRKRRRNIKKKEAISAGMTDKHRESIVINRKEGTRVTS